jgi:hypothetical protein
LNCREDTQQSVCVVSQRWRKRRGEMGVRRMRTPWSEIFALRIADEKEPMNDDSFQRWLNTSRRRRLERTDYPDLNKTPLIRVSNDRYAKEATFEDRLTLEDRQLLKDMGILP